jgi:hypothetical protein
MTLDAAFRAVTPETFATAIIVGFLLGAIYWAPTHVDYHEPVFWLALAGAAFFIPSIAARMAAGVDEPERALGTLLLWFSFSVSVGFGVALRRAASRPRWTLHRQRIALLSVMAIILVAILIDLAAVRR